MFLTGANPTKKDDVIQIFKIEACSNLVQKYDVVSVIESKDQNFKTSHQLVSHHIYSPSEPAVICCSNRISDSRLFLTDFTEGTFGVGPKSSFGSTKCSGPSSSHFGWGGGQYSGATWMADCRWLCEAVTPGGDR